jgi:hypothetical protein
VKKNYLQKEKERHQDAPPTNPGHMPED